MNQEELDLVRQGIVSCLENLGHPAIDADKATGVPDILYLISSLVESCKKAQIDLVRLKTVCGHPINDEIQSLLTTMAKDDEDFIRSAADFDAKCSFLSFQLHEVLDKNGKDQLALRFKELSDSLSRRWTPRMHLVESLHKHIIITINYLAALSNLPTGQDMKPIPCIEAPPTFEAWANVGLDESGEFNSLQISLKHGVITVNDKLGRAVRVANLGPELTLEPSFVAPRQIALHPLLVIRDLEISNVPLEEWVTRIAAHSDWFRRNSLNFHVLRSLLYNGSPTNNKESKTTREGAASVDAGFGQRREDHDPHEVHRGAHRRYPPYSRL